VGVQGEIPLVSQVRGNDDFSTAGSPSRSPQCEQILMSRLTPPVKVRELICIKEEDYRYGLGTLTLRVTEVPEQLTNPEWVEIKGFEIAWNGERKTERYVTVRVSALRDPKSRVTG
jgi:hypothetical protein